MMKFRFDAYDPSTGDYLRAMPAPVKAQIGDVFGARGTLGLSYAGAPDIPTFLEVRASVSFGGEWAPVGPSYLRLGGSHADTDPSGLREVSFVSREWILGKARVGEGDLELIDGKRPFYQASPGAIMQTLLLEAQDRGAAAGIELGGFTAETDSDGTAWSKAATIYYSPGLPIGDVLSNLVEQGMCDYRMVGNRLELFEPETALGRDLTTGGGPVRLRGAVSEAPVTYTLEDLTTSALLIGEDGFQVEVDNPSAPDDYGRLEVTIEQGGVNSEGTARTMIDAELQRGSREVRQITRTQHSSGAPFLPFRDYRVGDFVQALDQGQWQRYRVREIQLVMEDAGWTIHTVLNDRLEELLLRLANRTNGIVNGTKGSGGDGTRPSPPPAPGIEPAAPEGLVIDQQVYIDGAGDARGVVTAGWGAVTESTRGRAIDIGGYELWRRDNETYAPWRMVARTDGDLEATDSPVWLTRGDGSAAEYQWRVRAVAQASGRTGLWSDPVTLTMTQDTTPPPPPSVPVVETGFRIVSASWDGLDENGLDMPSDFSRVRVYIGTAESMAGAELVGSIPYPGSWNSETMPAGVPVWVAFTAVDRVGNESAMTPAVTVTPQALVDEESIQAEVDRIDGTIQGAVDDLNEAIDNIVIDDTGAVTYQTPTMPDETFDPAPKAGDIWFDTSDNMRMHRYDGTQWVSAADERIEAVQDAQERLGQDITDAEARALEEARYLAGMVAGAGSNLVVNGSFEYGWNGWSVVRGVIVEDATARDGAHVLRVAASATNTVPQTDYFDAIAGATYEISYWIRKAAGGTEPSYLRAYYTQQRADGSLSGRFATDDTGSINLAHGDDLEVGVWTQVRGSFTTDWDGVVSFRAGPHIPLSGTSYDVDSVSVIDRTQARDAATDAQAKADAARDAAIAEAESKDQQVRSDVDTAIGSARDDLESQINTVRTSVDGKNAITQSVDAPPTSYDGAVGDRWERMSSMGSGGSLISNWRWNGNVWVSTIISDAVLGNVDAAKIGTGYLDAARIQAGSIYADQIVSGLSQNMVPDPGFLNDEISANRLSTARGHGGADFSIADGVLTVVADGTSTANPYIALGGNDDYYAWAPYPGMKIVASIEARAVEGTGAVGLAVMFRRRDGSLGSAWMAGGIPTVTDTWSTLSWSYELPQDAVGFTVRPQVLRTVTVGTIEFRSPFVAAPTGTTLIEDGAVTTDKVLAGAIDAGKIAAGAIEAEHIVAGGIEASSLIVGGSIGETLIQDGAVTTRSIRADAVGADAIAAGVIDAGHIIAGGIQADAILVGGSVGATLIEDGAITTEKIATGSITAESGIVESLNAGVLTAGEIDAARIGARTLTGDKLLIGGGANLLPGVDNLANYRDGWSAFGWSSALQALWIQGRSTLEADVRVTLAAGEYAFKVDVRASVAGTVFYVQLLGPESHYIISNQEHPGTDFQTFEGTSTITEPGEYRVRIWGNHGNGTSNDDGYQWFRNLSLRPRVGGTLIEDGAITTDKILANAITAGKIATGAITAGKIAANAVRADEIAAGAIDGKTITGATIRTSASGARVQLNALGIRAYDANETQTFRVHSQTGEVWARGDFEQTNSYGSVTLGPQPYSSSTSSPGIAFNVPGYNWWGPGGLYARDDGSAGFPVTRMQGFVNGENDGSSLSLAPGGTSTGASTYLRRGYSSGHMAILGLEADRRIFLETDAANVFVRSRNSANTATVAGLALRTTGEAEIAGTNGNRVRATPSGITMNGVIGRTITGPMSQVVVGNGGIIGVDGSSRRWKTEIETVDPTTYADGLLSIDYASWLSRDDVRLAAEFKAWRAENPMCPTPPEYGYVDEEPIRQFGVIAEEVHATGVPGLVGYGEDGEPETVNRANFGIALIPVVKRLRDRVDELERKIGEMNG